MVVEANGEEEEEEEVGKNCWENILTDASLARSFGFCSPPSRLKKAGEGAEQDPNNDNNNNNFGSSNSNGYDDGSRK